MDEFLKALFSAAGVAGLILGFHLWKLAPELRAIWRAIDRLSRTVLLWLIARPFVAAEVKDAAATIIRECDEAEAEGKKREIIPP